VSQFQAFKVGIGIGLRVAAATAPRTASIPWRGSRSQGYASSIESWIA